MTKKLLYIFLFFVSSISLVAQPIANFEVNDSVGCNNLLVNFTNLSSGNGSLTYLWDFGNGTTSTVENPQVVYTNIGEFTISLVVTDADGTDTITKTNFIKIFSNPVLTEITTDINIGCQPVNTSFNYSVNLAGTGLKSFIWDFGDGNSSTEELPTHNFAKSGEFTVSLFVTDSNGCESNFTAENMVHSVKNPTVNFISNKQVTCLDTLTVGFQNQSFGSSNLTYLWDFGNGITSTDLQSEVFYSGFGNYTVTLTATDTLGCVNSLVKTDFINLQELVADINLIENIVCKHEDLQLENNTIGADSHMWDFADLTTSADELPAKNYIDGGIYEITYVAKFANNCSDTVRLTVTVDSLEAAYTVDNDYGCEFPFQVKYTDQSINANSWEWRFGNKSQSNSTNPLVEYALNAELMQNKVSYLPDTLIVSSENACFDTLVVDTSIVLNYVYVNYTPNDSNTYLDQFSGCIPVSLSLQNKSSSGLSTDPIVSYVWDFGDGEGSTLENPGYVYADTGAYEISLTTTNQSGCENTFKSTLKAGTPQIANFNYTGPPVVCGSEFVALNNLSSDKDLINGWVWNFSDGASSTIEDPLIQFTDSGYISGTLRVLFNNCPSPEFELDSFIFINGPAGSLSTFLDCQKPFEYTFLQEIEDVDSFFIDFGDGYIDSSQVFEVIHTYASTGNYDVSVYAKNNDNSCELTIDRVVKVRDLVADYTYAPEFICPGDSVLFNVSGTLDEEYFIYNNRLVRYLWDFKDSTDLQFAFNNTGHVFEKAGSYDVEMLVKDVNGCTQKAIKNIHVQSVVADFNQSDTIGCSPLEITFTDGTVSDTTITNWQWIFSDNTSDSGQSVVKTFYQDANYNVTLVATDAVGCVDTVFKQGLIYNSNPTPNFSTLKPAYCLYDSIEFTNLTAGGGNNTFMWDFGNGLTSTETTPKIPYVDTGYFDITLLVVDSLGCDSQIVKTDFIYIQPHPIVDFESNAYSSECYPKIIRFDDLSIAEGINYRLWDFGDELTTANQPTPFHTYNKPGNYSVSLTVRTTVGCSSTLVKDDFISILGPYANIDIPENTCVNISTPIQFTDTIYVDNYFWTFDDGSTVVDNPTEKIYETFGIKTVYLTLASDTLGTCIKQFVDSLKINELVANFSLSDTVGCTPLFSTASNTTIGGINYDWILDDSFYQQGENIDLNIEDAGLHIIKLLAENTDNCKDSIKKQITVHPLPVIQKSNDTLICEHDSIYLSASGGIEYKWYLNNQLIEDVLFTINVKPNLNSKYIIEVTDVNTCVNTDSILIEVQPQPNVNIITDDSTLIIGEEIDLEISQQFVDNIEWFPFDNLSCENCANPTALPLTDVIYKVTVSDNNECFQITDSINIKIDAKYSVDVPSSFTPNNDGVNDALIVAGWGIKDLLEFTVYDQYGRNLFTTDDLNQGWDGSSQWGNQVQGMYLYSVKVRFYDDTTTEKQGYVYLLR